MRVSLAAVLALAAAPAVAAPSSPVGDWIYADHAGHPKARIHVVDRGGELLGSIAAVFAPDGASITPACDKCDGALRGAPMVGMTILHGLRAQGDHWSGGSILDTENGTTYDCNARLEPDGAHLRLRGYVGISLLGRTEVWTRAAD